MKKHLFAALLCTLAASAAARQYAVDIDDGITGTADIQGSRFKIESIRSIYRGQCKLEGRIKNGSWRDGRGCVVRFAFEGKNQEKLTITPEGECSRYCGEDGSFKATYTAIPALCTPKGSQAAEQHFQAAYRAQRHPEALEIKKQYVEQCGRFATGNSQIKIYNDLADSYLHTGDKAACRRTLAEIAHRFAPGVHPSFYAGEHFPREQKRYEATTHACAE